MTYYSTLHADQESKVKYIEVHIQLIKLNVQHIIFVKLYKSNKKENYSKLIQRMSPIMFQPPAKGNR